MDEKSLIEALERTQPMRLIYVEGVTQDDVRHVTTTLLAPLDVATDRLIERSAKTPTAQPSSGAQPSIRFSRRSRKLRNVFLEQDISRLSWLRYDNIDHFARTLRYDRFVLRLAHGPETHPPL